jgi:hypothetical protein
MGPGNRNKRPGSTDVSSVDSGETRVSIGLWTRQRKLPRFCGARGQDLSLGGHLLSAELSSASRTTAAHFCEMESYGALEVFIAAIL